MEPTNQGRFEINKFNIQFNSIQYLSLIKRRTLWNIALFDLISFLCGQYLFSSFLKKIQKLDGCIIPLANVNSHTTF